MAWHFRWLRDDFAPPHNVNLVGDGIAIVLVLLPLRTPGSAVDRIALRLMVGGATLFVVSAPIDVINHRINGLDITSWSITHFGLYTGTAILIAGVIRAWRLHLDGPAAPAAHAGRALVLLPGERVVPGPAPGVRGAGDRLLGRAATRTPSRSLLALRGPADRPPGRPRGRGALRAAGTGRGCIHCGSPPRSR